MNDFTEFKRGWDYEAESQAPLLQSLRGNDWYYDWDAAKKIIATRPVGGYPVSDTLKKEQYYVQNKLGCCTSKGSCNSVMAMMGNLDWIRKFTDKGTIFNEFTYGCTKQYIDGQKRDSGATIGNTMRALNTYGVLFVNDLSESDRTKMVNKYGVPIDGAALWYKRGVPKEYIDKASHYQIKTTIPDKITIDTLRWCLEHGCAVFYGTDKETLYSKSEGRYVLTGRRTAHCMALVGPSGDEYCLHQGSYGEPAAPFRYSEVQKQINSRYYDAAVVFDVER